MMIESRTKRSTGGRPLLPKFEIGLTEVVPATILREVTEQEYIDSCLSDPACPEETKPLMVVTNDPGRWWYEVSVD